MSTPPPPSLKETKYSLFKSLYTESDIDINHKIFDYSSLNFPFEHSLEFPKYFAKLKEKEKFERHQKEEAEETEEKLKKEAEEKEEKLKKETEEKEEKLKQKFLLKELKKYFNDIDCLNIISKSPSNFFFSTLDESFVTSTLTYLSLDLIVEKTIALKCLILVHQSCMEKFCNSTAIEKSISANSFSTESKAVIIEDNYVIDEFYPFNIIYTRDCYGPIMNKAIEASMNTCVAILGDPGIGKTTLLRYMFSRAIQNINNNARFSKIFWAMESGNWLYFDRTGIKKGEGDSKLWKANDVLLLIDGSYRNSFLSKIHGCILFCSPEQTNYSKMIKMSTGISLYMPPWSWSEIDEFYQTKLKYNQVISTSFRKLLNESLNNPETATINFMEAECDMYRKEKEEGEKKSDEAHLLELYQKILKRKFEIVGGRVRHVFNDTQPIQMLHQLVLKAARSVSASKLNTVDTLDYHSEIPSILYSLIPINEYKYYQIVFASRHISEVVKNYVFNGDSEKLREFFFDS
jgi:hypothetical protein